MSTTKFLPSKECILRQKKDNERPLRVAKCMEFPFLLKDSPVEAIEGYVLSDRDTVEVFASFIFKNVSQKPIRKLKVRLSCYLNQNIPYCNIDFTYCQEDLTFGVITKKGNSLKLRESNERETIETSEIFGSSVLIPLPESYFTKLEVTLLSVEYDDGTSEKLNILVSSSGKRYKELDDISKIVYSRVNIYQSAETQHPTVVLPQFGSKVWLCCCGNKNPGIASVCERCGREKEWQEKSVTAPQLEKTREEMVNDPSEVTLHDKSNFKQNKYLESDHDLQKKMSRYEQALKNLQREEELRQRKKDMVLPKTVLWMLLIVALILVFSVIIAFANSNGDFSLFNVFTVFFSMLFG